MPDIITTDPEVLKIAQRFRKNLDGLVQEDVISMAEAWRKPLEALEEVVKRITKEIQAKMDAGEFVGVEWFRELDYYKILKGQVQEQYGNLSQYAIGKVAKDQLEYAQIGAEQARALLQATAIGKYQFPKLPQYTIEALVSNLQQSSPLETLLRPLGAITWEHITSQLEIGLAMGKPLKEIATALAQASNLGFTRALVITRTEVLRAHRAATMEFYRKSSAVTGFKRLADARNGCMACIAKDGELFTVREAFYDHPNGRCTLIPIVAGVAEPTWEPAWKRFETLPESEQKERMGIEFWHNWKEGRFTIKDLGSRTVNPIWGDSPKVTPLSQLVPSWREHRRERLARMVSRSAPVQQAHPVPTATVSAQSSQRTPLQTKVLSRNYTVRPNPDRGAFQSQWVTFDDGSQALMKPSPRAAAAYHAGAETMSQREALSYQIANRLGLPEVPETFFEPSVDASFMMKVTNAEVAGISTDYVRNPLQFGNGALLDVIIGNTDRHDFNWMIGSDGRLWLIDHGLTFHPRATNQTGTMLDIWRREYNTHADPQGKSLLNLRNFLGGNDKIPIKEGSKRMVQEMYNEFLTGEGGGDKAKWYQELINVLTPDQKDHFGRRLKYVMTEFENLFEEIR